MRFSKKNIYQCLRKVLDPELGINLVDLGLIYQVELSKDQKGADFVFIKMTLTTPGCPLAGTFDMMLRDALKAIEGLDVQKQVEIELSFDPPWNQEMMSKEAKIKLGLD